MLVCVSDSVRASAHVCVCVCARARARVRTRGHLRACVRVCVFVLERLGVSGARTR